MGWGNREFKACSFAVKMSSFFTNMYFALIFLYFHKSRRPVISLKKRLWNKCFPVNFAKFSEHLFYRTPPDDCWNFYWDQPRKFSPRWKVFGPEWKTQYNISFSTRLTKLKFLTPNDNLDIYNQPFRCLIGFLIRLCKEV